MPDDRLDRASSAASDPLVAALFERVRRIADGNGVAAADIRALRTSRIDREVRLRLRVQLGWCWSDEVVPGRLEPNDGYREVRDDATARVVMEREGRAAASDPVESAHLLATLRADPVGALETFSTAVRREQPLRTRLYCHEICLHCRSEKGTPCACGDGKVDCRHCAASGQVYCWPCSAKGYTEYEHVGYGGFTSYYKITCGLCCGSGWAPCNSCDGDGWWYCPGCGGSAWHDCEPCEASGYFTRLFRGSLTMEAERSWLFGAEITGSLRAALVGTPMAQLAREHALEVRLTAAESAPSAAWIDLSCRVPHICLEVGLGSHRVSLEAIGAAGHVHTPPPFLDCVLAVDRNPVGCSPTDMLAAARRSRLGRRLLAEASTSRSTPDEAIAKEFEGAASTGCIREWRERLGRAYDEITRAAAARVWRWLGPTAVAMAATASTLVTPELATRVLNQPNLAGSAAVWRAAVLTGSVAVPIGAAWLLAALAGLIEARASAHARATRLPQQGARPFVWLVAAAAACVLVGAVQL
ncbi:hypothetical protein [Muricoccus vinaceus]|uniref:Uncharacterized protein n=1 Tax=Muricoccus vinaceus TaxID=424704 RepID=A0ABV6INF3_9PROT